MKSSRTLAIIMGGVLLLGAGGCVKKRAGTEEVERGSYTLTKKAYNHIAAVMKHAEAKRYDDALHELDKMSEREFLNPYEKARMWQMYSGIYFAKNDFKKALESLHKAYELSNVMPMQEALDIEYNLAQLYLMTDQFEKSGEIFTAWLKKAKNAGPEVYYMTASAFAQGKNYKKALPYAEKALKQAGDKPKEPWLVLALSINYELKRNQRVAALLKTLINMYPKKQYWMQLSQTFIVLEKPDKALAVLELAYAQDFLTEESELLTLAQLQMQERVPIKAATLIEKHFKNKTLERNPKSLELLAKAYLLAQERKKAKRILATAAKSAETGELYFHLGRIHIEDQDWKNAKKAANRALRKGKLPSPGQAHLLIGIAEYNEGRRGPAMAAFNKALKDKDAKSSAKKWISLLKTGTTGGGEDESDESSEEAIADKSDDGQKGGKAREGDSRSAKERKPSK